MPPTKSQTTTTNLALVAATATATVVVAACCCCCYHLYYHTRRRSGGSAEEEREPFRRLTKAEKRALKYERAKKRVRDQAKRLHRKQADWYKALTDEERAEVKAFLVARDEEREARLGAVVRVDAPFVEWAQGAAAAGGGGAAGGSEAPALSPHLRLCIDLGYGETVHGERGTRSLGQQVGWIWNAMKLAPSARETPVLHLVSYQGQTASILQSMGIGNWAIHRHAQPLGEVFPREAIVYLSPDAEETLEELDLTKVYVIGGIVDRNIVRGLTVAAAGGLGVRTARLPLEHLNFTNRKAHRVLNIDTVAKALMAFHATGDWAAALGGCVPKRQVSETSKKERRRARWAAEAEAAAAAAGGGEGAAATGGGEEAEREERKV